MVLEKTSLLGGTSAYSGGGLFLPGNQAAARAGVADSIDRGRTYLLTLLGDRDGQRREAFLTTAPALIEFFERNPALRFEYYSFPDYFAAEGRLPGGGHIVPTPLAADQLPNACWIGCDARSRPSAPGSTCRAISSPAGRRPSDSFCWRSPAPGTPSCAPAPRCAS